MGAIAMERPEHVAESLVVDFNIYSPPGANKGPHEAWKSLHNSGVPDLVWTHHNGGHWIATRYKDISAMFADHVRFTGDSVVVPKLKNIELPSSAKNPLHRELRLLIGKGLGPANIAKIGSQMRSLTTKLIEKIQNEGKCDFIEDFASIFPVHIFLGLTNLPVSDAPALSKIASQYVKTDSSKIRTECLLALRSYFDPLIDERLGRTEYDDLLSHVVNGTVQGRPITRDETRILMTTLLLGGLDTTVNALGFMMHFLATHSGHRSELVADRELLPAAIDEMFRRFPLVVMGREIAEDIEYDGVQLRKGEMIILPTILGGLDERVIDRPMVVDFHRQNVPHVTFGNGMHKCPGAHLARAEIKVVLEEWLTRIPDFEVVPGSEITYSSGITVTVNKLPLIWKQ